MEHEKPALEYTIAEIIAPLQQDFEATGMTDEELGAFVDAEIKAYCSERRDNPAVMRRLHDRCHS
jgi:hypothetical protein